MLAGILTSEPATFTVVLHPSDIRVFNQRGGPKDLFKVAEKYLMIWTISITAVMLEG